MLFEIMLFCKFLFCIIFESRGIEQTLYHRLLVLNAPNSDFGLVGLKKCLDNTVLNQIAIVSF